MKPWTRLASWLTARRRRSDSPTRPYSLKRRLILTTLGSSVVCWLISLVIIVTAAWQETSDVFDDSLEEGARMVATLSASMQRRGELQGDDSKVEGTRQRVRMYYQVMDRDGELLLRSRSAPRQPFVPSPDLDDDDDQDDDDFYNVRADGKLWRVYVRYSHESRFYVQTAQPWDARLDLLGEMAERLTWPALILLLLLGLINWLAIRRLLRPLEHMASVIGKKSPDDLRPVPQDEQASELRPIIEALNGVFARLDQALQSERRFTADAAHELRTPLAALRMKIQLMQRTLTADDDPARTPLLASLQQLRNDVDRCTSLVENLLALARLDPQQPDSLARESIDLPALIDAVLADCAPAMRARQIHAETQLSVSTVHAHSALLHSALRNVIDNAVRYGRPGGRIRIQAGSWAGGPAASKPSANAPAAGHSAASIPHSGHRMTSSTTLAPHGLRIVIQDDGPGVDDADLARLSQRFFRVLGSQTPGSGLGLSIVARIIELHGGTMTLGKGLDGNGLGVTLELPDAAREERRP